MVNRSYSHLKPCRNTFRGLLGIILSSTLLLTSSAVSYEKGCGCGMKLCYVLSYQNRLCSCRGVKK